MFSVAIFWLGLVTACAAVLFGAVRLVIAVRRECQRRAFAEYQAALIVCNAKREAAAAAHRAAGRRAAEDCQ